MFYDDNDDTNDTPLEEEILEPGEYDLGDDIGERIGKDDSSEQQAL